MFSVRETPWHGLGAILERAAVDDRRSDPSLLDRLAGRQVRADRGRPGLRPPSPSMIGGSRGARRSPATTRPSAKTPGTVLGIVGERYRIVQNEEAFQFVDQLLGSQLHFETAGSLHGGRRVWVLATLPDYVQVGGDAVRPYVLLMNSHDGSTAVIAATTPVRVVCQNTLNWGLLSGAAAVLDPPHRTDQPPRMHEARRILELSIDYYEQFRA